MTDNTELKRLAENHLSLGQAYTVAKPSVILALIAENEEYKAVSEQPASLNASPATEYEGLKRQFFALRNYALCKDKLSGYYSRELEKMRGVDRSQSAGEIDAERDINEQLTNDLLAMEAERDQLKAENDRLESEAVYSAAGFDAAREEVARLKAENEALRKRIDDMSPFKGAPFTGPDTKCLACGGFHYGMGGLPCPKMSITAQALSMENQRITPVEPIRATHPLDAAMGKEVQS